MVLFIQWGLINEGDFTPTQKWQVSKRSFSLLQWGLTAWALGCVMDASGTESAGSKNGHISILGFKASFSYPQALSPNCEDDSANRFNFIFKENDVGIESQRKYRPGGGALKQFKSSLGDD